MHISRRSFLKAGLWAGAGTIIPMGLSGCPLNVPVLDPRQIAKYRARLIVPPAMPAAEGSAALKQAGIDYYEIAMRQFRQQILPWPWPRTTVWSYGVAGEPGTFLYPARTIEAQADRPVRVKWINQLVDGRGNYLPHLFAVDQTLHWANPSGGMTQRDMETKNPLPYLGPIPMVTHLHGGHSADYSDGYPAAWYLPAAANIPGAFASVGTWYDRFRQAAEDVLGQTWTPGSAVFQYANDQSPTTLWYHDHSLGITRVNVYAGPAGFYLLRGGSDTEAAGLPGPSPKISDPPGTKYYEIPVVIQDRSFNLDGSLFYPSSRVFFDGFAGPYVPDSDIAPIWNSEFFANAMVANGQTWPVLEVEPRRYRLRWLNGCNSRFLFIKVVSGDPRVRPVQAALPMWQIGADGGFLPVPVARDSLRLGPAERADTVVDFTGIAPGTELYLINEGPDDPYGGGVPDTDFAVADPQTTGQVMKFVVTPLTGVDTSVPPEQLTLPGAIPLAAEVRTRDLLVSELDSAVLAGIGPRMSLLGTVADGPLRWRDAVTENPGVGDVEVWNIHNTTEDAHPIHLHQVQFEIVGRSDADGQNATAPETGEAGRKDTVTVYPGGITTVRAQFDLAGRFIWHCHILEHEDNEMMRPYHVGPIPEEPA